MQQALKTSRYLLAGLILVKLALHCVIIHPVYELHRDEFLHLDIGQHLAGGYLSVPPFTALVSVLIKWLGNSFFWIKFFPVLFGVLTMVLVWRMVEELLGGWYAQLLAGAILICSALTRLNMLYQPNSFDVLCWTWVFYLLIRFMHTGRARCLLWLGVAIGLGFLNKYNILFLVAGLVPAVLLSPQRKVFFNKYLYLGVLVALLIALPNIWWQISQGMPVLHHMQELTERQLVHVNRLDFIKAQLFFFIGGSFLIIGAFAGWLFYRPFAPYRFLGLTYLLVILLFLYLRAKDYYAIGLYPMVLAFGSVYWEHLFSRAWGRRLRWAWVAVIALPFVLMFDVIFPVLSPAGIQQRAAKFRAAGALRWEDGKEYALPQDYADMLGWREMAGLARKAYEQVPDSDKARTLIICGNYGQAGALNYYNQGKTPSAVAFNADYIFWFPRMDTIRYVILLDDEPDERARFYAGRITKVGQVQQQLAREYGTGVFLLSNLSPLLPAGLQQLQADARRKYRAW